MLAEDDDNDPPSSSTTTLSESGGDALSSPGFRVFVFLFDFCFFFLLLLLRWGWCFSFSCRSTSVARPCLACEEEEEAGAKADDHVHPTGCTMVKDGGEEEEECTGKIFFSPWEIPDGMGVVVGVARTTGTTTIAHLDEGEEEEEELEVERGIMRKRKRVHERG